MAGNDLGSIQENHTTFSFRPFILILYRDELVRLIEKCGKEFPNADIQIGENRLEQKIQFKDDIDLPSNLNYSDEIAYRYLYICLRTSSLNSMSASLILDLTPHRISIYLRDRQDGRLVKLSKEIMQIIRSNDPYRFIRNRFVSIAVYIVDFAFLFYIIFLKDMIEKIMNFPMPDLLMLILVLLLNSTLLVPHGKNRIFLKNRDQVGIFVKYRDFTVICAILFLAMVNLVLIILKLVKVI